MGKPFEQKVMIKKVEKKSGFTLAYTAGNQLGKLLLHQL